MLIAGVAFEHGCAFGLALLVAFMLTAITQVIKDKERFIKRDLVERIELQKIKIKLQVQAQAKREVEQKIAGDQEKQQVEFTPKQFVTFAFQNAPESSVFMDTEMNYSTIL